MTRALTVAFPAGRGVDWWVERNSTTPVPGLWPYGLEQLRSDDTTVSTTEVAPVGRFSEVALAAGVRTPAARRAQDASGSAALCWDENTAAAMVSGVRAGRLSAGVIWATDEIERGGNTRAIQAARTVLRGLDALWVLAEPQIARVADWLGAGHPPIHFLPFGVDQDFYAPTPYGGEPVIASLGGDRDRDAATLYEALAIVRATRPDARAVVQSTSTLSPPDGVELHDFIPHAQVRELFARSAVIPIATRPNWHGSGMTVSLEAAACARPVVACDAPGMRDYIRPGVTGELVTPGDADAMAAAILDILNDPAKAAEQGLAGRTLVETERSTKTMCEHLRAIALGDIQG